GPVQLLRADVRLQPEEVPARLDRHGDLFERCVASALANAVDAGLHLPGAGAHGRERVRRREPQVVVTVDGDARSIDVRDVLSYVPDKPGEFLRYGVANGIGNI